MTNLFHNFETGKERERVIERTKETEIQKRRRITNENGDKKVLQ